MISIILEVGEYRVHVYAEMLDGAQLLNEGLQKGNVSLGGPYSASVHGAHTSPGEKHLHVYCKKNQLFALNFGGSAHDKSHGVTIPNKVAAAIQRNWPDIILPPNNLIESASSMDEMKLYLEDNEIL